MYAGRIIEEGPVAQVLRQPQHPYTAGLLASLPANAQPGMDLVQIPGSTPSLFDLPPGCAFQPRCERRSPACVVMPELTSGGPGRRRRCHHPLGEVSA